MVAVDFEKPHIPTENLQTKHFSTKQRTKNTWLRYLNLSRYLRKFGWRKRVQDFSLYLFTYEIYINLHRHWHQLSFPYFSIVFFCNNDQCRNTSQRNSEAEPCDEDATESRDMVHSQILSTDNCYPLRCAVHGGSSLLVVVSFLLVHVEVSRSVKPSYHIILIHLGKSLAVSKNHTPYLCTRLLSWETSNKT